MIQKTRDKLMLENTEVEIQKDNPDKLATQDIQETRQIRTIQKLATQVHKTQEKINVREYGRVNEKRKSRETGNIGYTRDKTYKCQRIPKG